MTSTRLITALLCLCAPVLCAQPAASGKPPSPGARDFARLPTYEKVELSPDGTHLAMTARVDGVMALGVVRLSDMETVSALHFPYGNTIVGFDWSAGNRVIAELGTEDGALARPQASGELAVMDLDGRNKAMLFSELRKTFFSTGSHITSRITPKGRAYVEDPLVDDPKYALIRIADGDFAALYRINETNGETSRIAAAPVRQPWRYFVDRAGRPRLVWGVNDSLDAPVIHYRQADRWQPLPLTGAQVVPLQVSADGRWAYFRIEAADGRQCLVEWDSSQPQAPARELVCRPGAVLGALLADVGGKPYAVEVGELGEVAVINPKAPELPVLLSLQKQFSGQVVQLVSASRDHGVLLYRVRSDRNSGEFFIFNAATGKAAFLDALQSWLDPAQMAEQRRLNFTARDGLSLAGYLTLPPGKGDRNLPLVVMPHGGPIGVRDRWGWDADAQFLASRGYAVLQVNFRGSGGYGEAFRKSGYREWGGKMIDDLTDSVRALIASGTADAGRVCIYGGSYGGYAALMSAVREPGLYRCAVGYAGVYDLPLLFKESDVTAVSIGRRYWQDSIGKDPSFLREQSPVQRLDSLRAAVLIVHGKQDPRAPYGQAKALREGLERRKLPYEWLVKDKEMHGFYDEANRTEFFETLGAFIDRHIGTASP